MVKNLPAMRETWIRSLGWEDPLEEGMAVHSSVPAWRISRTEEPGRLQSMRSQRVGHDSATKGSTAPCWKKWTEGENEASSVVLPPRSLRIRICWFSVTISALSSESKTEGSDMDHNCFIQWSSWATRVDNYSFSTKSTINTYILTILSTVILWGPVICQALFQPLTIQ